MRPFVVAVFGLTLLTALQLGCDRERSPGTTDAKPKVTILAAASLRECVQELVEESGLTLDANFFTSSGASSSLAQQIQSGAPADLFLSANKEWAEAITGKFPNAGKKIVARNSLVLIAPAKSSLKLDSLAGLVGMDELRLGISGPEVPAGQYARQSLDKANILNKLVEKNRLVIGQDVRQVLRWVELGEVDAGLVYKTDVGVASAVKSILEIDPQSHEPIEYWLVSFNQASDPNEFAGKLYEYFGSESARKISEKHGFLPPK